MTSKASHSERRGPTKTIRHYDIPGHVHELTFSISRRRPVLVAPGIFELLAEAVDRATDRHSYALLAYVFMPEHVHLLVRPGSEASPIAALLKGIKGPTAARVRRLLEARDDQLLRSLNADVDGRPAFRLWQAGPGYDRNITSEQTLQSSIEYIHANPIRRGLVERPDEWRWSSWHEYVDHSTAGSRSPRVTIADTMCVQLGSRRR